MKYSLEWKPIGLEQVLKSLVEIIKDAKHATPSQNTRTLRKLDKWLEQIQWIYDALASIEDRLMPSMEKELGLRFKEKEVFYIAMIQPSTRNLFLEIDTHFKDIHGVPIQLSDLARVLALIGDAVIDIAVIHALWSAATEEVGILTQRRAKIVSNENLAIVCNRWGLYDYRIHFDPKTVTKSEMEHIKGTLVEAIYGVLYVEYGFDKVLELIDHIVV